MASAVHRVEPSTVLANAAHILKEPVRRPLSHMAQWLSPLSDGLEKQFVARLKALRFESRQVQALIAITTGTAARVLGPAKGNRKSILEFLEQVEYSGRRLAKLNLPPSGIQLALQEYDKVLLPLIARLGPERAAEFRWANEQLHFCVLLTLNNAYYQVRESETQAYNELFRIELESRSLHELLRRFLTTLATLYHADSACLFFLDKNDQVLVPMAFVGVGSKTPPHLVSNEPKLTAALSSAFCVEEGGPNSELILDRRTRNKYTTCWSVPLLDGSRLRGVMQFRFRKTYEWLPREQEMLEVAGERCLMAAAKARLMEDLAAREEQVRRLAERMLQVEEMERRRISRELHDEAGQSMLCIRLQLEMIEGNLGPKENELKGKLQETRDLTERTILEIRRLIAALSPAVLEQLGLGAALRQLVSRFSRVHTARVKLALSRMGKLPKKTEVILYRLVQECMNNVAKHSQASHVNISLESADGVLRLNVEDDGIGFEVEEALSRRDSYGLAGLRERVALLGGKFYVESHPRLPGKDGGNKADTPVSRLNESVARGGMKFKGRFRKGTRIHIELPLLREVN
ncbi:GAF domain-containing sensor histidine kinase [Bryobacter aggregatus]|uniref:GAF domain-containing sensor histidine kinase n=1 Tax=Bryobacter aggregatus TaxID=360054 RepID=UPI00068DE72C|nr:GAF domain-containing sensor histidine kinase [Bryobacter aggregatus]